jgi:DMSO/TMAO reductase YedYZ molybdopterin-dependent catalytic subunit
MKLLHGFIAKQRQLTRRELLEASIRSLFFALVCSGIESCRTDQSEEIAPLTTQARLVDTVAFASEGSFPMNTSVGTELDGRLFTDLSAVNPYDGVTPTERFYIRTRVSNLLDAAKAWSLQLGPEFGRRPLTISEISKRSVHAGVHLMECAGNSRGGHFGMLSVANWEGMPISDLLDRLTVADRKRAVLISGFDEYESPSNTSTPGASWIFQGEDLRSSSAFLATTMNGQPLTRDHGAPVRLIVPNWYGCACIKWVNEIRMVDQNIEATAQMQEYAGRTHQSGVPKLAAEYQPATIDTAAMPIRIEKWSANNSIRYKVVGLYWGGVERIRELGIQFNPQDEFVSVRDLQGKIGNSWGFWSHVWAPKSTGTYVIRLKVLNPAVRTRRLDSGYYTRTVDITEV